MSFERQPLYEFGPFRLEPSERLLLRAGESVSLPPKAFETLLLMVQNSGHVLSKDELMRSLWPNTFVEENNLTQHISTLRRALGEGAGENGYIETVPKLGYRFAVPVREIPANGDAELLVRRHTRTRIVVREQEEEETSEAEGSEAALSRERVAQSVAHSSIRRRLAAIALAAIAAIVITKFRSELPGVRPKQLRTLAVIPFRDLKPDTETQFLSYSLADAIISRLGYFDGIVIRPSSYVAKFRGGEADPRSVAQELHVEAVLTGTYTRDGDRLRISTELVDVAKAEVIWRDTFDVPYGQLLTVQDRVAEDVVRGMRVQVLPQTAARLKPTAPHDPLAYEYLLRGVNLGTPNDYRYSMQMLEKSVELDPTYAPAWMYLGEAYASYRAWQGGGPAYARKSRAAFDKAVELDPDLPSLRTVLAIQMMEHGELDKSVVTLREELRRHPDEPLAHWWLTEAYLYGGMLEESIAEGERALALDPMVNSGSTFNTYLHAGDYQKFLSTLPAGEGARTIFYRGLCHLYMGDDAGAAAEFERAYAEDPSLLHAKYGRAFLYAIRHQFTEGREYLGELERTSPVADGEMLYKMAQAYATLGDTPSAVRLLHAAMDHNFYCYACFVRDPLMASLHGESRYTELLNLAFNRNEAFKHEYFD